MELAERQCNQVDPANRLVAAELERRWESARRELRTAQATSVTARGQDTAAVPLSADLRRALEAIGQPLPELWHQGLLSQAQKKALLRCLIDKVVIHRRQRDTVLTRIVWQGGDVTVMDLAIGVGSWSELSQSAELEQHILTLHHQGLDDATIAQRLTAQGYRSPLHPTQLLTSTVKGIRLKHRVFVTRSQSHPRRIPGYLTVPQVAAALAISPYWFYDRIKTGVIVVNRDPATRLYLFPDTPETLDQFRHLLAGSVPRLSFDSPPAQESETTSRPPQPTKHDKM